MIETLSDPAPTAHASSASGAESKGCVQPDSRPTLLHFIYGIAGGGAETMMRNVVCQLDRNRWRIVVVAMQTKAWPAAEEPLRLACDALHCLDEIALLSPRTLQKFLRILHHERPAIVQTWMHHADFVGGLLARWTGVPHVVWGIHCREITQSPGESAIKSWLFRQLLPIAAKWVPSRIISCSQTALEDHVQRRYPRAKMQWIANGIDTLRFRPQPSAKLTLRETLCLPPSAPLIGFLGRFHEMKNLPLLLQAFALLQSSLPSAQLALFGILPDDLDETCRALVEKLRFPHHLHFRPFHPNPESIYPALDLFTLSSRTEACPMTIIEAMACGLPCITTDVGDCSALIAESGLTVPAHDPTALAHAWQQILTAPAADTQSRSQAARTRASSHFSIQQAVSAYSALYASLIIHPASTS
jgi:glycosyltransferase involved in cell wall biosynthesis